MKKYYVNPSYTNVKKILGMYAAGMILLSSCGTYTSVTPSEAYDAGYTIGRIISGN